MSRAPTRRAGLGPSTACTHRAGERCQHCPGSRPCVLSLGARRSLRTPPSAPLLPPKAHRERSRAESGAEQRAAQAPAQGFPNNPHTPHPLHGRSGTPRTRDTPNPPPAPGTAPTLSHPPPGSPSPHHGRSAPSGAPQPRGTPPRPPHPSEPIRPHRHFGLPQPHGPGLSSPRRRARSPSRPGPEGAALSSSGWASPPSLEVVGGETGG